ncbi:fructosamine kinase family protein [Luteolibacter arcticus]|uniref:Fructosamine kinase family protein n=1 Tax=Luteolibacter arcticus TaxID=1581411 RepID=A0ABT3GSL6_9BACT|nr:fructosamine kinase family protein [Luteolibacter arcticus]MCW1926507.1 fructosamine kinase family protein [Luteolibacter arcticus]
MRSGAAPVDDSIAAALGSTVRGSCAVGGGCIHQARRLDLADGRCVFVKSGGGEDAAMLEAEARGLDLLAPQIRVPQLLGQGVMAGVRWLAMEWLDLRPLDSRSWENLGRALAALHRVTRPMFGLDHDNFIGATPQENGPLSSWCEFFIERRLKPQLRLASAHPLPAREILEAAEQLLADHHPPASLLHGDLWSGNAAALPDGNAIVFDPAPYFGDAETDLAMLQLFGGVLPAAFYSGYGLPDPAPNPRRRRLYDLYHALNHLNLFGNSYLPLVRRCLEGTR